MSSHRKIIKACLFTPTPYGWGLCIALVSGAGKAKTAILSEVIAECGMLGAILSPGERGEGGFGCVPVPTEMEGYAALSYPSPDWAIPFFKEKRGVVVVDELTTAPPALQPAMLGLTLDRRIGGNRLPRGVRTLAIYNPPEVAANGHDLPPPVANRMGHLQWDPGSAEAHADHLISTIGDLECVADLTDAERAERHQVLDPAAEEARVLREWPSAAAIAAGAYSSFIAARPALIDQEPAAHDPAGSGPWASRRTWEFAVRAYAASMIHGLSETERDDLICSFVGQGPGGEFITFVTAQDLPNPKEVLDGEAEFSHDPTRLDRTNAVLDACTALIVPTDAEKREKRTKAMWKVLDKIAQAGAKDVCFHPARRMAKAGLLGVAEARPVLAKLNKVMEAAGIKISS